MNDDTSPPAQPDYRMLTGYALLGLGWPAVIAAAGIAYVVFLPRQYGPSLLAFHAGQPLEVIVGVMLVVGLVLVRVGMSLARGGNPGTGVRRVPPPDTSADHDSAPRSRRSV